MLPTSTKVPDRFMPEGSDVTYLIEVPGPISKARYRRAVTASGARIWSKAVLVAVARQTIEEAAPENAEVLLSICHGYENIESGPVVDPEAADETAATAMKAWQDANLPIVQAWADLSRVLQGAGGDFAARVADNEFWWEVAPIMAARAFLLGTDSLKMKRGADGLIPEATLAAIPEDHIPAIGWRAMALFSPSGAQAKNSASPRRSPPDQANLTAVSSPQTEANGTSSETGTSATQS